MKSIFVPALLALSLSVMADSNVTPEPKAPEHEMTKFEKFKESVKSKWDEYWAEVDKIEKETEVKEPKVETKLKPDNNSEGGPIPTEVEKEEAPAPVK